MARTIKLRYEFNTAAELEVEYKPDNWARVTPNHFRSYLGPRRINSNPYEGTVYYEGTNFPYTPKTNETNRIIKVDELNDLSLINKYKIRTLDTEPYVIKANRY
jgi:hypothetical protein